MTATRERAGAERIAPGAAAAMRASIRLAGGREVCFVATVDDTGTLTSARTVARGDVKSVLAIPGCAKRGQMLVHNHPSGELDPSDADSEVAYALSNDGVGFAIVDNAVTDLYVVVEVPGAAEPTPLDEEELCSQLTSDGGVGRQLHPYEERESQHGLLRAVTSLYNSEGVGILEAGTGVGKSLAYLLPALRWSARNGDRTVVSTNTINLQEQITGKDLPLLERALTDQKVRYVLVKGWRNYLCLQRLANARGEAPTLFDDDGQAELERLAEWSEATSDGSLSDLTVQPRSEVWDEVAAEADLCTRQHCPFFQNCFLFKARREAAHADVIVVNHHLLMADLMVRRLQQNWTEAAVLPVYDRLIIDEGHNLEDAAAQHLGSSVSRRAVQRLLGRLDRRGRGLLNALMVRFTMKASVVNAASFDLLQSRLAPAADAARRHSGVTFDLLRELVRASGDGTVRITSDFGRHEIWGAGLDASLTDVSREINVLADGLELLRQRISGGEGSEEDLGLVSELRGVGRRLSAAAASLEGTLRPDEKAPRSVQWVESRGKEGNVAATTVPLDLSTVLREDLFRRVKTTVITSATLSSGGSFDFITRRLGLDHPNLRPVTRSFPSSFHYQEQALLAIPGDFPRPNENAEAHIAAVVDAIRTVAGCSDGGLFVLCTSHRDVRAIAMRLRHGDFAERWPLLVHGEGDSRDALLRRFREAGDAVLVGTSSFWEGVDVRGRALRGLVITRIPFQVPTEPMTAARCEQIADAGGDPFREYLLPHAALRLKQGFGRLIRSSTDFGAVVIADPRIVNRSYGELLLESLPPARMCVGPWEEVRSELQRFYRQWRTP